MSAATIDKAIRAWQMSADVDAWPHAIDCILIATWRGAEVAWPMLDGEAFSIIKTCDSSVVHEEELSSCEAHRLAWQIHELGGAFTWGGAA